MAACANSGKTIGSIGSISKSFRAEMPFGLANVLHVLNHVNLLERRCVVKRDDNSLCILYLPKDRANFHFP